MRQSNDCIMIYLDNAATSLRKPEEVTEAVVKAMQSLGNAGRGVNDASLKASRNIFRVREQISDFFHAGDPSRIAFTANSTESLNIAIKGILKPGDHVISTVLEHNSVLRPLYEMEKRGVELTLLDCDEYGMVYPEDFRKAILPDTRAIICTHGSNLTGNLLDIEGIGKIAGEHGILFIVDGSQTAGVFDSKDDAAVYQISDDIAIVQTLDYFPPMVDDPYVFGKIAAANALSDIYAMGGEVKTALNIVCFPESMDLNVLGEIMRGGSEKVIEAGGTLAGGHSIADTGVKYGLSVMGVIDPKRVYQNNQARPGDKLILTKKLGVGIICTANRVGEVTNMYVIAEKMTGTSLIVKP